MEILYRKDNNLEFGKRWNEYLDSNLISYQYLLLNIDSLLLFVKDLLIDNSFVIVENNQCVGICFLPIENLNGIISISRSGVYIVSPLSVEKRIEKKIYKEIERISVRLKVQQVKFCLDPLILEYKDKFNTLLEYGFIDSSTTDCLVDLNRTEKDIWKALRKSYKGLINSILKDESFEIVIIDCNNVDYKLHEMYRELHSKCAGGATRSKETFDKQFEMLQNKSATLIGLKYKNKFIGFNYFFHFQKTVIYASGADDPEYENKKIPIYHVLLWSAIQYYKNKGFDYMEFSQPCGYNKINGFNDYLDEKQISISYFKRGMSSRMIPFFRGIKYFDKAILINDLKTYEKKVLSVY